MKTNQNRDFFKYILFAFAATGMFCLAGCATTPKNTGPKYIFFPPAPDEPRIQYLTSYASEKDLRGNSGGTFMNFVTGEQLPDNPIFKPYGAATGDHGIYVCDTSISAVLRLDLASKKMSMIAPTGAGRLVLPLNMAWGGDGLLYIADSVRNQVVILNTNGEFVATLGENGKNQPRDVALAADRIYVGDSETHCVHVYDRQNRQLLFDIPNAEDAKDFKQRLFQPDNIAVDTNGQLYVSDIGAYRVQVYDRNGKFIHTVGGYGDNVGEFARPKGIAVDRQGWIYVADAAEQVVQMFNEKGQLLMWFGEPGGSPVSLMLPSKVVIDYDDVGYFQKYISPDFKVDYLVIVINQLGPRKVSVFGYGHKK